MKVGIDNVGFTKDGCYVPLVGQERKDLLLKAYRGEDLGGYSLYRLSTPRGEITRDDIRWDTSGFEPPKPFDPKEMAREMWEEFNTPVDDNGRILAPYLHFPQGTDREEIWSWFEEAFGVSVADLMAATLDECRKLDYEGAADRRRQEAAICL